MSSSPTVDVNLFVYNSVATVGDAIESVLAQTWRPLAITLIDDGSTDGTLDVLEEYARRSPEIRLKRNRANGGAVANFQRAFWLGDADYIMPKSGDDVIAPDFIAETMSVLRSYPDCAMCHAGGLVFTAERGIVAAYPDIHRLHATGADALARARHVMATYTSSPSFWGVYRRSAVDRLARIGYRAGWDHVVLAELALYGEIRHVPKPLYWRRDGGRPVRQLARAATEGACRGASPDEDIAELRWHVPLITTAYAHIETFAIARIPLAQRKELMLATAEIFRDRWEAAMRQEVASFRACLPQLVRAVSSGERVQAIWRAGRIMETLQAIELVLPDEGFGAIRAELTASARQDVVRPVAA